MNAITNMTLHSSLEQPDEELLAKYDWGSFAAELDNHGCAVLSVILTPEECGELATPTIVFERVPILYVSFRDCERRGEGFFRNLFLIIGRTV